MTGHGKGDHPSLRSDDAYVSEISAALLNNVWCEGNDYGAFRHLGRNRDRPYEPPTMRVKTGERYAGQQQNREALHGNSYVEPQPP